MNLTTPKYTKYTYLIMKRIFTFFGNHRLPCCNSMQL